MTKLSLAGCRVLDMGIITAGAATAALLADLGAEVIKIESPTYRDPFREWIAGDNDTDEGLRAYFRFTNRNKQGVSLNLKHADGRQAFLDLAAKSDIVIENFRRGVLDELGIGYPALQAVRPDIILASISSQGEDGPDASHVSFGTTLEATAGLAWLTGYAGGDPVPSGRVFNYPDQVVALFAAGIVLTAWRHRQQTGHGAHLDISQRELTSFLVGEEFGRPGVDDASATVRIGNGDREFLLQDCLKSADRKWVAVSIRREQASALSALDGVNGKGQREALATWVASRSAAQAVAGLREAGLAAACVNDGPQTWAAKGQEWQWACQMLPGDVPVKGFPFQLRRTPMTIRRDAPRVGADTAEVLARIAGYDAERIRGMARTGSAELGE